jgi:hypothetical protein
MGNWAPIINYTNFQTNHKKTGSLKVCQLIEGSLEAKLPTMWTDEKQRWEESGKRRQDKRREEDQKRESLRRKIQVREKVGKSRNTVLFR